MFLWAFSSAYPGRSAVERYHSIMKTRYKKGDRLKDWTLDRPLDQGGNSFVWVAVNNQLKYGAIKICRYQENNKKKLKRFCDEVHAFKACQDIDGVLPLLDYWIPKKVDSGVSSSPWLVTKLAIPLEKAISDDCTLETIVQACASIAGTLSSMHDRGFSHRDIKPANLFHVDNKWCVGDFGLAWFPDKSAKTGNKEHIGPRFYIADEMLNNAAVADGKSADVYSLAKTLWKLATGQRYPLQGTIRADEISMRLSTYSGNARSYLLDPIIESATQHDPAKRISMKNLCNELKSWLQPPAPKKGKEPSLTHLSHRVQSLHGSFKAEQKLIKDSNETIERRINHFLGRFTKSLDSMNNEIKKMGIESRRDNGQGNHHAWYVQKGNEGTFNVFFWQNFLTAHIRKLPGTSNVSFFVGVCIRIESENTNHGIKYVVDGPVSAASAIAISNDKQHSVASLKKHVGGIREFILSGPEEELAYNEFISLLENNFESGFEKAIKELENINQSAVVS